MSDITLQSQQLAQNSEHFYDAQRYQSMRDAGSSIMQTGQMIQENRRAQTALDQHWVEIAQRGAAQQAEIDLGMKKLQFAQALDGSEMSRQNVRQATLQNNLLEQQVKESQKRLDLMDEGKQGQLDASLAEALSRSGNAGRFKYDPNAPADRRFTPRTDEEYKTWVSEQEQLHSRLPTSLNPDVEIKRAQNEWIANIRARHEMELQGVSDADLAEFDQTTLNPSKERYQNLMSKRGGPAAPSQNGTTAPKAKPPEKPKALPPEEQKTADSWASWVSWLPPETSKRVAGAVMANREELAKYVTLGKAEGRDIGKNPYDIAAEGMKALSRQGQSQDKYAMLGWLVSKGILNPQEAQQVWDSSK